MGTMVYALPTKGHADNFATVLYGVFHSLNYIVFTAAVCRVDYFVSNNGGLRCKAQRADICSSVIPGSNGAGYVGTMALVVQRVIFAVAVCNIVSSNKIAV